MMNIAQAIPLQRVPSSGYIVVAAYFPLGVLLALFRLFLTINFLCSQIFFNILFSRSNVIRRAYERIFCIILGVTVIQKNSERNDRKSILVMNSISNVDGFFISILCDCFVEYKRKLSWFFMDLFRLHHKDTASRTGSTLIIYPEPYPTAGKSLLKFSDLTSSRADLHVQPVAVRLVRPLSIAGATIESTMLSDLFWIYFSIINVYELSYLPVLHEGENETKPEFADRIRQKLAEELDISCTNLDESDVKEFIRRRRFEARKPQEHLRISATTSPLIREMVQQVKDVLPHVPVPVIAKDLEKTRSVDVTVANLLEGVVQFVPESSQHPVPSNEKPSTSKVNFLRQTKRVVHDPTSFQERKEAFINEARDNYLRKRGLL